MAAARALPISAVLPTRNRPEALDRMLQSLRAQDAIPAQLIVVDASDDAASRDVVRAFSASDAACAVTWRAAAVPGAAAQRNEGVALAAHPTVAFFDDDIVFEPGCVAHLWRALEADPALGGVNAMITNQRYARPGPLSSLVFRLLAGRPEKSYAGRVLGPAVNLLPDDSDELPEVVPVDWLNTTCTLYRRAALEDPPFGRFFTGYSLMEDLALSLVVGRTWALANVRTARIFHDSQPGQQKDNAKAMSRMEFNNRHYVMRYVLGRRGAADYARLALWELFQLSGAAVRHGLGREFRQMAAGKVQALTDILSPARGT